MKRATALDSVVLVLGARSAWSVWLSRMTILRADGRILQSVDEQPAPARRMAALVIMGKMSSPPPPGLSETDRSDWMRIDLSRLSRRRLVKDSLSGHHVQPDNPMLTVSQIRELIRQISSRSP